MIMYEFFNDVEVLQTARFDYQQGGILDPHAHKDFYQLIYCFDGTCTVVLNKREYSLSGSPVVIFIRPHVRHGLKNFCPKGLKTLEIKFKIHSRNLAEYCKTLPYLIPVSTGEIYEGLERIRKNGMTMEFLFRENCNIMLGQILITLIRVVVPHKQETATDSDLIPPRNVSSLTAKVIDYIKTNDNNRISAQTIENEMHYTYRYISKLFAEEMGMTPIDYIEHCKNLKAQKMLKDTELPIKYIGEILGYSSTNQFYRVFTKCNGIPPKKWRDTEWFNICKGVSIQPGFVNSQY